MWLNAFAARRARELHRRSRGRAHGLEHRAVVARLGDHGHARVVLCGAADHGGAADVDVLDDLVVGRAAGDGLLEGVEVDAHQIDRLAADLAELGAVRVGVAHEDAAVHPRVQGLDAPIHDLRRAGEVRHVDDRHTALA